MTTISISCPSCGVPLSSRLASADIICCGSCRTLIDVNYPKSGIGTSPPMPDDWSFVRSGTTGVYNDQNFTVIGRVRLQLRNDYKNFWCVHLHSGEHVWMRESFASFAMVRPVWRKYDGKPSELRANGTIALQDKISATGQFVEKCESIAFEGVCGKWPVRASGFFYIEAANTGGDVASFFVSGSDERLFLTGHRVEWESLRLKNIFEWNEWK